MKLAEGIEALELTSDFAGRTMTIYPVLFTDHEGPTLVDTGMPGQLSALLAAIEAAGVPPTTLRRIILTHQDIDHIGNASELREAFAADVLAHEADAPYIQGEKPLIKLDPSRLEAMLASLPEAAWERTRAIFSSPPSVHVDRQLHDGDVIPIGAGVRVVHTPGHTPGHISLYVPGERLLIAGDSLRVEDGQLLGPGEANTPDMERALLSVREVAGLEVDMVLCYHGGPYGPGAGRRLREIAGR